MSDHQHSAKRSRRKVKTSPVGSSPGTLIADPAATQPVMTLTTIASTGAATIKNATLSDVRSAIGQSKILWLDCAGLADVKLIEDIGKLFNLHPLALEDTVNTGQRSKTDIFDDHVFVLLSMIDEPATFRIEEISLFFGTDFVVTFQERTGDPFDAVRKRIDSSMPNRLRAKKADYLAYALIDAIVDSYFPLAERLGDKIDHVEDEMMRTLSKQQVSRLHLMRRHSAHLKRVMWPIRDAVAALTRGETPIVAADTKTFLNDTLDHATSLIEMVESQRDMLTGLIELHLALSQARTNDIISFLTIVSAIFIPLTFLAGIWGMNFDPQSSPWNMPELEAYYGYPGALGFMLLAALGIVAFFKWRKWL